MKSRSWIPLLGNVWPMSQNLQLPPHCSYVQLFFPLTHYTLSIQASQKFLKHIPDSGLWTSICLTFGKLQGAFSHPSCMRSKAPYQRAFPLLKAQFQDATPTLQSIALIFFKAIFTLRCMFIIDNIVLPLRMKAMWRVGGQRSIFSIFLYCC